MLRSVRYSFDQVQKTRIKDGVCPICKRATTRQKRFEQTINPYNLNEAGQVKSRDEVEADVEAEADAWEPDFTHERCRPD